MRSPPKRSTATARRSKSFRPRSRTSCCEPWNSNHVERRHWGDLPAGGFFKHHLLKEVVGIYYSHPDAWSEIGFGGPASPRGYARLGPDERDPWEAEELDFNTADA